MFDRDNVRMGLLYLDAEGWSELIDDRWTLQVKETLENSGLDLSEEDITRVLDIVIIPKPNYNEEDNEWLKDYDALIDKDNIDFSLDESIDDSELNVTFCHDYYKDKGVRELCHRLKDNDMNAICTIAKEMNKYITDKDVIVPIPSRDGSPSNNLKIALEIQSMTDCQVDNILRGKKRDSLYDLKLKNKGDVDDKFFGFTSRTKFRRGHYILLDGVYDSGTTAYYASKATDINDIIVYAKV